MKKQILSLLAIAASTGYAAVEEKKFDAEGLTHLEVLGQMGDIEISGSDDAEVYVAADKVKFDQPCQLRIERIGHTLQVEVKKETKRNGISCHVDFKLKIPRAASIHVRNGLGNVAIAEAKGDIEIKLGRGDVTLRAETPTLSAEIGSGSIKASGSFDKTSLELGSGTVELTYLAQNPKGRAKIDLGSGDMTLYLPETAKISTNFKAGFGKLHQELVDSKQAHLQISAKAGRGSLWIKKRVS